MILKTSGNINKIQSDIDFYLKITNRSGIKPLKVIRRDLYKSFEGSVVTGSSFDTNNSSRKVTKQISDSSESEKRDNNFSSSIENDKDFSSSFRKVIEATNIKETQKKKGDSVNLDKREYAERVVDEDGWLVVKTSEKSKDGIVEEDILEENIFEENDQSFEDDFDWDYDEDESEEGIEEDTVGEDNDELENSDILDDEDDFDWDFSDEDESEDDAIIEEDIVIDDDNDFSNLEEEYEESVESEIGKLNSSKNIPQNSGKILDKEVKEEIILSSKVMINGGRQNTTWRSESEVGGIENLWGFDTMEDVSTKDAESLLSSLRELDDLKKRTSYEPPVKEKMRSFESIIKEREEEEIKSNSAIDEGKEERVEQNPVIEESVPENDVIQKEYNKDDYRTLRDFVKRNPNCSIEDALKVFPKKEIEKEIRAGRVYKGRNRLFI